MKDADQEIFQHAVRILQRRDCSVFDLRQKLLTKFGTVPDTIINKLISKRFLDDRRYAENYVRRHKKRGSSRLREELLAQRIPPDLIAEILSATDWPSLHDAAAAKMVDWNLRAPLHHRDAARLFRALVRLGYEEDAIREEIEQLHEQQ